MPLHDAVGTNCKKGATTDNQGSRARYSKLLTDSLSYVDRIHNDGCSKVWCAYVGTPN